MTSPAVRPGSSCWCDWSVRPPDEREADPSSSSVPLSSASPSNTGPDRSPRKNKSVPAPAPTEAALAPIVREAVRRWTAAGAPAAVLAQVRVVLGDPPGTVLARTQGTTITIDRDAAGHGWFVDPTPRSDREFRRPGDQGEQNRMDLLTTVLHEVGHVLGHLPEATGVMADELTTGERLGPAPAAKDAPAARALKGGWFLSRSYRR